MKNILVITLSNLGDVIMTTPVIMALAAEFPDSNITVVVGPKAETVLKRSEIIGKIVVYDKKANIFSKINFLKELRKNKYDSVVDLRNTAIPFLVSCKKRSPLFREFKFLNKRENHLEVLKMMKMEVKETDVFKFFSNEDERNVFEKLKAKGIQDNGDWILVAPGAASERKRWDLDNFREVIRALSFKTKKTILLVGDKNERPISEGVARGMSEAIHVVAGETSLSESAALVSRASLVISNDSAIMHLGFEMKRPTVGIFGPTDHMKYGHQGDFFRLAYEDKEKCSCEDDKKPYSERTCFHGLKPEKVLERCLELF